MLISKIENFVLPQGWSRCCLTDFTDIVMGQSPTSDTYNKSGSGIPFFQGKAEFGAIYPTVAKYCSAPNKIALVGATLLSIRAPVGPTNLAKEKCCIGRGLAAIHPAGGISPMFVLFLLRSIETDLSKKGTGSTFSAINKQFVEELEFGLPPLSEQHRIVAKIEELFSELDKGIENLKTAQAQLKVYRQALLKHAFEGKLTAQWRAERRAKQSVAPAQAGAQPLNDMDSRLRGNDEVGGENDEPLETAAVLLKRIQQEREQRYRQQLVEWEANGKQGSKPKAPKTLPPLTAEELAELPELPEGWGWVRVGEIAEVQLGRQRSPDNRSNKFPTKYIRAGNFTDNGLNLDDVLDMEFEPQERARFLLKAGDVLLSEASGSAHQVGKPAVWRSEIEECCFQNTVIRVRSLDELSEYLFWVFKTYYISGVFSKLSGGVGINHLSAGKLESMAIPLVAIAESKKVLELINEKLSLIENLDQTITTSLQQAEALRQSILKKAFSGQLVPQDPNDEPASELLARIRAERADTALKTKRETT